MLNPFDIKPKLKFVKINSENTKYILIKEVFSVGNFGLFFVGSTTKYFDSFFSAKKSELNKIKKIVYVEPNLIYITSDDGKKKKIGNLSVLFSKQDKSKIGLVTEVLWVLNKGVVKFYAPFNDKEICSNVGRTKKGEWLVWNDLKQIVAKFKVGDVLNVNKNELLLKNGVSKIVSEGKIKLSNTKRKKMFLEENKRIKFFETKFIDNKFFKIKNEEEAKLVAFKYASFFV